MQSADFVCGLYFFVYVLTAFFPPAVLPYLREGIPMRTLAKDILTAAVIEEARRQTGTILGGI